jgi:two-component system, response regulator YesN
MKTWIKESLDPLGNSISFFHQDGEPSLITILNLERKSDLLSKENVKSLNEVINNLKTKYGIDATIALGNVSQNIFDNVSDVFNNAQKALGFKFFLEVDNIIAFSTIESFGKKQVFVRFKEEEELTDAIRKLDKQKALSIIDDIIGKMVSDGYPVASKFKDAVIHILLNQVKMIQNAVNEEKFYFLTEDRLNTLRLCTNYSEFNIIIRQVIYDLISSLDDQKGRKNELIFSKCMDFIEKNYAEDLSLETLAETFYFNPSYFSTLFKNYTRVNFSQYLLNLRMKKGKELLEKTDYKVYEVAARIGYKDSKYFNRVFKKEFGVTPDEYRRI